MDRKTTTKIFQLQFSSQLRNAVCTTTSVIFKCWPIPTSFSANSLQSDTLHLPVPSFKVIDLTLTSLPLTDTVLAISSYKTYTATKAVFKRGFKKMLIAIVKCNHLH